MTERNIGTYKDLIVWQKSMDLVEKIYKYTKQFPNDEIYCLVSQIRRAAISIPSNIAEGKSRGSVKEYKHFLTIAYSSASELETQIEISRRLRYGDTIIIDEVESLLVEILKMLKVLIAKLRQY